MERYPHNKLIKAIENSDSFIVMFRDKEGDVFECCYNISSEEVVVACEVLKAKILKDSKLLKKYE